MPAIVVPVFRAAESTQRCLNALARSLETLGAKVRVFVIDDGSNCARVDRVLDEAIQMNPDWTVHRRPDNRGFVHTANQGIALADRHDVVLLNSDTIPVGDWLPRMARCAQACPDAASVTPFTNNGEIASITALCEAAPLPDDPMRWAEACQSIQPPQYPALPTAVGFCMYLRRHCIEQIGVFDANTFGLGYGEENDWCLRATTAGWTHRLCDDAFVAHEGHASFGPLGLKPDEQSMQRLLRLHPGYTERVDAFIQSDPIAPVRQRILERLHRADSA
ncbi:MAG: glycosyltransferase [Pseudomonadota bacterium]